MCLFFFHTGYRKTFISKPFDCCTEIVQTRHNTQAFFEDVFENQCLRNYLAQGVLDVSTEFVYSTTVYLVCTHMCISLYF